jgi:D-alanyl-D-alanine carboxypeptidase
MRNRTVAISVLLFTFVVAGRLSPAWAGGDEALLKTRLQEAADSYVAQRAEAEHFTGLELQVSLGKGTPAITPAIVVASGTDGRLPDPQPMDKDTLFQVGSNGKGFTAAIILKLEAEELLNIDQTLGDWLPQYPAWKSVTIRSLLNMTSGVPDYAETVEIAQKIASDIHHQFTPAELIAAVDPDQGSTVPPTTGYDYSNTNYILAGLIIEKASGMSYREALRTLILNPLHLRDTYYADGPYPDYVLDREPSAFFWDPSCPQYQPQPCPPSVRAPLLGRDVRTNNLSWGGAAGAMVSPLGDLTRWYRALFGGRVLPPPQLREMTSLVSQKTGLPIPDVTTDDPAGFGLGLQRYYIADLDGAFWVYQGGTLGSRVLIAYWPQYDLVITMSANSAVAGTEDKMVSTVLPPAFAALKDTGAIAADQ